jgi:hypothetical protein
MLEVAQRYEKAFDRLASQDPCFESDLNGDDWKVVRNLLKLLQKFYNVTKKVSGSLYTTCNAYLHNISSVAFMLNDWCAVGSPEFRQMCIAMKVNGTSIGEILKN